MVTDVPAEVGSAAFSFPGREIAQIVALDPMLAVVEVAERRLAGIKVGDAAEVRLVTGQKATGRVRFVSKSASQTTRTYRVEVEIDESRRRDSGRHHRRGCHSAGAGAGDAGAALGADLLVGGRPRRARRRRTTGKVEFVPVSVVEDEQNFMWVAGIPDGARVIVQGQDFVREGQRVEAVAVQATTAAQLLTRRSVQNRKTSMFKLIDYAISHARLTIATLLFLLGAGFVAYRDDPEGGRAGRQDPDHLRAARPSAASARRMPSGCCCGRSRPSSSRSATSRRCAPPPSRAAATCCSSSRPASIPSRRSPTCAPRSTRPSATCRRDADEPAVQEVNLSLYPVLVVALSGDVPERTLLRIARNAKNAIEQVPGVLSAELRGARDEAVEIIAEPMLLKSYGVSLDQLIADRQRLQQPGRRRRAGRRDRPLRRQGAGPDREAAGRAEDSGRGDLGRRHRDARRRRAGQADLQGRDLGHARQRPPAMTIEVSKRTGANLIETVDGVKTTVEKLKATWPEGVQVTFTQDKSKVIRQMLADLQNSVATGVLLVVVIILFALGFRASLFIGIAIPASFLAGVLGLQLAGLTVNIVVLFSLILAVGMLVDDAIIVSEFAERRMSEGMPPQEAYSLAAKRMSGPVIAATATRVAAFSPLLFWPGVVGEFMKYLPITLIATLSASLAVALFFTPTLGALLGKAAPVPHDERAADRGLYMRTVRLALRHPGTTLALAAFLLVAVQVAYGKFGRGVEFFPNVEPDFGQVIVHGRGNLSLDEKNRVVGAGREARARHRRPADRLHPRRRAAARHRARSPRTPSASSSSSSPTGRRATAGARDHGRDPRPRPPTFPASWSR